MTMNRKTNERQYDYDKAENQHLKLEDLKEKTQGLHIHKYLIKENIPASPAAEFHVSRVKHDTDLKGLRGIGRDGGFQNPGQGPLLWWSLSVGPDDMASAEERLLEATYPDRTEEQAQQQQSFLGRFATSPAFSRTSRLGSYRFTFPLEELLTAYSEQFCSGEPPVMRVFGTHLYKQQVMYVVLVHSPDNQEFSGHPILPDDPNAVCTYKDGRFIWRSEAMSETHRYELVRRSDENQMEAQPVGGYPQFYVWDHVAVALHVDNQMLKFDVGRLRENLKFCSADRVPVRGVTFEDFTEADGVVQHLWPDSSSPLEKDEEIDE